MAMAVVLVDTRFGGEIAGGADGSAGAVCCRARALDSEVAGPLQVVATRAGSGAVLQSVMLESSLSIGWNDKSHLRRCERSL
jgi:hypothetical protein